MRRVLILMPMLFLASCDWPPSTTAAATNNMPVATLATVREQPQTDCLIEDNNWGKEQVNTPLTKACKQRLAEGWRLLGSSNGQLVWVK